MKRIILGMTALVLLLSTLAGCGKKEDLTTVSVNEVTHSVFYAPFYAAMELGFFEEEGLQLELTNGGGADKVMTAVLSGQSDIGLAGPEACIYVHLEGREDAPKIFAQLTKRDGSFLVGRTDEEFSWENLKGTTILGGRKGGVPEMTLEYVMRQNGVIPHEDAVVDTSIQFNMMAGAFTGGTGDYVALFEPTATQVVPGGQGVHSGFHRPGKRRDSLYGLFCQRELYGGASGHHRIHDPRHCPWAGMGVDSHGGGDCRSH